MENIENKKESENKKDFHNRKVKFYIIERKEVKKPKITINNERTYDEYDLSYDMWRKLSHRASDDLGFLDRDAPKIPYSWKSAAMEKVEYKQRNIKAVINDVKKMSHTKPLNTLDINNLPEVQSQSGNSKKHKNARPETILAVKVEEKEISSSGSNRKKHNQVAVKKSKR